MPRRTARRAAAAAAEGVDADKDEGRGPVASPGFVWIFVHLACWLNTRSGTVASTTPSGRGGGGCRPPP